MSQSSSRSLRDHLRRLSGVRAAEETGDAELLRRWVDLRDEAAFELLVWRHGGMVLDLCQRILAKSQDAEDAFQATFLVLIKKAASVRNRAALGSWLYKVAFRVALAARERAANILTPEAVPAPEATDHSTATELQAAVTAEVERLPERYRAPIVLCVLEGRTVDEASAAIGCARWTLATRLARGKERLRRALSRRGFALSVGSLTATLAGNATAAVLPPALVHATAQAAMTHAGLAVGFVIPAVASLADQVGRAMLLRKVTTVCATLLLAGVTLGGLGLALLHSPAADGEPVASTRMPAPLEELDLPPLVADPVPPLPEAPAVDPPERQLSDDALTVFEVSADGNQVSLKLPGTKDDPVGPVVTLELSDRSRCEFSWVGRGGAAPAPGMIATRMYVDGTPGRRLTRIHLNGDQGRRKETRPARAPDFNTTVVEVGPDAQRLALALPRDAGEAVRVPIRLSDETLEVYFRVPPGGAMPRAGYRAMVWLAEGSTDQAAVIWFIPRKP